MPTRAAALGAALAVALAAGCGSTVQVQGSAAVPGGPLDGLSSPSAIATTQGVTPAGGLATPTGDGTTAVQPSGSLPLDSGQAPDAATPGTQPAVSSGHGMPQAGRGFTKTTITVGVATANDYNKASGALGIKGVSTSGDPLTQMQAVADEINRHGGVLGRKLVLVPHDYSTLQTLSDAPTANQAACVDWTQDHHVFAVLLAGGVVENTLLSCLQKAQTPLIYPGAGLDYPLHYAATYSRYPEFFNIGQMVGDLYDRIAIGRLAKRSFFTPWDTLNGRAARAGTAVTVGLLGADDTDGAQALASQQKQLAAQGIRVSSTNVIRCPRPITDTISCQQSAVLKFASNHVTHVFGAGVPFLENAESQHYRPRYFLAVEPRTFAENVPAAQLAGAMGESYVPIMDVEQTEYPGDPTPATGRCKRIMKAAGQAATDPTTLWTQSAFCDEFFFLAAGIRANGTLGPGALRTGLERLGTSEQSAVTWGTFLSPRDHTTARVLRDLEFRSDIKRFAYTSKTEYG